MNIARSHEVAVSQEHWNLYSGITPSHEDPTTVRKVGSDRDEDIEVTGYLTKKEILDRRISMLDELIQKYTSEYWLLGEELLSLKSLGQVGIDTVNADNTKGADNHRKNVRELFLAQSKGNDACLPHAVELQQFVKDLPSETCGSMSSEQLRGAKQEWLDQKMNEISRIEMSSHAALCREMDAHGALAMLCGMNNSYFIRSHIVSIGRNRAVAQSEQHNEKVDIDISGEAALYGHERMISRLQAKIFKDTDGAFRIQNCSKSRPISVDGIVLTEGEIRLLRNMSLISVAAVSFLFMTHVCRNP